MCGQVSSNHPHFLSILRIAMDFLNWEFADAPTADAALEQNRAHDDGNP